MYKEYEDMGHDEFINYCMGQIIIAIATGDFKSKFFLYMDLAMRMAYERGKKGTGL